MSRKPAILIDFDKTISPIHGFNLPPTEETVAAIKTLHEKYYIAIYSCRGNNEICDEADYLEMITYLNQYHIPYDEIRRDKPLFAAIIDDRAFNPIITPWNDIVNQLMDKMS